MKYSNDGVVRFDPEKHRYWKGDKLLQGVTSYISMFKHPFDSETIATNYAIKHGMDKDEVLKQWFDKAQLSIKQGHAIHSIFENYTLTEKIVLLGISAKETVAEKFIKEVFQSGRLNPVAVEQIVYNDFIASQIDQTAIAPNGQEYILDWKTNSSIDYTSWNDRRMLGPYSAYPDCSFYHYSIQVAIYRHLYPAAAGSYIVHIGETDYKIIKPAEIVLPKEFYL